MNKLNKIKKLLEKNYNFKNIKYKYFPKTNEELKELINDLIKKYGDEVDLNNINVSNITDFNNLFKYKCCFNGNISEWDVSNGISFFYMFFNNKKFNSNLSQWDVSNGINFSEMFRICEKFNSNIFKWNVSNGEYFNFMFYGCKSFNADLSQWCVNNAKSFLNFASYSLLEKYPERIPEKFKTNQ